MVSLANCLAFTPVSAYGGKLPLCNEVASVIGKAAFDAVVFLLRETLENWMKICYNVNLSN
ncbi:MAG: hypothetical protein UU61_C0041G0010 [Parcubacteria group bacterium GW2011_GWB1_41_4]|nr:MAG: hypothetical protein UU61_C0041G0010 [Parcubacteria group bacterium GW2011_GWB1_41_4]